PHQADENALIRCTLSLNPAGCSVGLSPARGHRMLLDGNRRRSRAGPRPHRRRRPVLGMAIALPVALLGVPATSYVSALTAPGSADWQTTSVEWVRDHGGGPLVDAVENWWYARNRPTGAAP